MLLRNNAKKGAKARVIAGFIMPFSKNDAGNALFLSRQGARFWLSMSFDKAIDCRTDKEIKAHVASLSDDDLLENITGFDLGVARQVTDSNGTIYHLDSDAQKKLTQLTARARRHQRRVARIFSANDRVLGKKHKRTNGEKKALAKASHCQQKQTHINHNNAHQISRQIADNISLVAAFENMTISNLMRAPKAKQCPKTGKWLRNGRAAKRGLNKALSQANMGKIRQFSEYKLIEQGKLLIKVKTAYSSQTCSECNYRDKNNRLTQVIFSCLKCFHTENADVNAAKVLRKRGFKHVRSDTFTQVKTIRKTSARRKQVREKASLGSGDNIRLSFEKATVDDALNTELTAA